ncbi:MAG: hypothetical protein ABI878_00875 [Acidobacteriota bacterium]
MTDEEINREVETEYLRTINRALRKTGASEKRVIGSIQKIDCDRGIVFTIKTDSDRIMLLSNGFSDLQLNAFVPMSGDSTIGCDADLSSVEAVVTYKERVLTNGQALGDILSVEFVPNDFRILSDEEMNKSIAFEPEERITDRKERAAIFRGISKELSLPEPGQKREVGYLQQIECTGKGSFFNLQTSEKNLRLFSTSPTAVKTRLFTRELEGMQFGCVMKPIDVPVVFIYREMVDSKNRYDGELYSLEFVPRDFILSTPPAPMGNRVDTAQLLMPEREVLFDGRFR